MAPSLLRGGSFRPPLCQRREEVRRRRAGAQADSHAVLNEPGGRHGSEAPIDKDDVVVICFSGRGDKDVDTAIKWLGLDTAGTASESAGGSTDSGSTQ